MTTPTPKYQIGQEVWVLYHHLHSFSKIQGILVNEDKFFYAFQYLYLPTKKDWIPEDKIFPTKQSLIDSL